MRILLDECVPRPFRRELSAHEVSTIQEMSWTGKKNGALLALAQDRFDVLLTTDQNLRHQQNLAAFRIAVVVMAAASNRLADLVPLAAAIRTVVSDADLKAKLSGEALRTVEEEFTLPKMVEQMAAAVRYCAAIGKRNT